jgi:thiamine-phosphate pyrophosphorylase
MSNLMQKIKGIYAITPNEPINIAHIEALIIQHKISVLQYRHKRRPAIQTDKISNDQMKLNEALALRQLCTKHHTYLSSTMMST